MWSICFNISIYITQENPHSYFRPTDIVYSPLCYANLAEFQFIPGINFLCSITRLFAGRAPNIYFYAGPVQFIPGINFLSSVTRV